MSDHYDRFDALREYFPDAKKEDWRLWEAGQRVQIIKKDEKEGGVLRLGTEVVSSKDGSITALLGASPGASTAAPIMFELLERCFADQYAGWVPKLRAMVPSYGKPLSGSVTLAEKTLGSTARTLEISATV